MSYYTNYFLSRLLLYQIHHSINKFAELKNDKKYVPLLSA